MFESSITLPDHRTVTFVRTFGLLHRARRFDATMVFSPERGCVVDYLGTHQHIATDLHFAVDEGALETLRTHGIARASARTIAMTAGVNQALIFYHFGSVDELLAAACRHGSEEQVALYRDRFASVTSVPELLELGRALHAEERAAGNLAVLAQLLAGGQTEAKLAPARVRS